jgi:hypothetical protein
MNELTLHDLDILVYISPADKDGNPEATYLNLNASTAVQLHTTI